MLAEGTREVAAGNLDYKVQVRADDEIGILVDSFNQMTGDLGSSKPKLEAAYSDLQDKHDEMEMRRRYIETVLERDDHRRGLARSRGPHHHHQPRRGADVRARAAASVGRLVGGLGVPPAGVRGDRRPRHAHGAAARGRRWSARYTSAATAQASPSLASATALQRPGRHRHGRGAGLRRPHRAAQGPAPGRVARGGPAHRARDQEPAHAHPALRPAAAAAAGRRRQPRGEAAPRGVPPRPSSRRSTGSSSWWTSSRASRACPRLSLRPTDLRAAARRRRACSTASRIPR